MQRRKLNNADLDRYGSYENFCKLQDEFLASRVIIKKERASNIKEEAYKKAGGIINSIAWSWSQKPQFLGTGLHSHDDLYQEGSLVWSKAYDTYHTEGYSNGLASFKTYAHTCITNRFKDILDTVVRKAKDGSGGFCETLSLEDEEDQESIYELTNKPLSLPEWEEKSDVVRIIRSVLSERDGNILMLRYGIGVGSPSNIPEIANLLGMPPSTVHDVLHRSTSNEELKSLLLKFI